MADGQFDWNQFSETPQSTAVADPQFAQNPDLGLLNSLYGGGLSKAAPTWQTPPHDWNQYPTEAPPQSYEEQINQTQSDLDQQAQEADQARQAAEQEAANQRRIQVEQTRARLQAQDAAKAQRQQDENFNPETGSSNNSPETLNAFDQALLGTGEAVAGFGRQAGGLLQSKAGFRDIGKKLTDYSTEQARQFAEAGQVNPTDTTGQAIHWLASSAVGLAPIMAAGVIPGGAAAMMGLQSFGSNYASAVERYQADGDSYEEATRKAYLPAIVTGAISTAIGHYAGPNGLAALGSKAIVGETVSKIAGKIIQDAGIGGAQGLADSFANGLVQKATYEPEKPISQILMESLHAGAGGLLVGGLASGVHQGISAAERATRGPQPPVIRDVNPPELSSQTDNPNAINPSIQLPDQNVPRVTNPTVPVPDVTLRVPPVGQPERIPVQAQETGTPRIVQLPKIDVPEPVLQATEEALRINPLGLDQAVSKATENHPVAKFYDQLPDAIDTSTPEATAQSHSALQRVVTKIESSDLSPQEKAAGIAPIAQILTDFKSNESPTQNPSEAVAPAQSPATEHPIGLRQADASGATARVTGPDTGNGQPTPSARTAAVQPEASKAIEQTAVGKSIGKTPPISKEPVVGGAADAFGAIYGPKIGPEVIAKIAGQVGESYELPSPKGVKTKLVVKSDHMLWVESSRSIGDSEQEVGVAYLKIRSNGQSVLDGSLHGREIDKIASNALLDFLQKTGGNEKTVKPEPAKAIVDATAVSEPVRQVEAVKAIDAERLKLDIKNLEYRMGQDKRRGMTRPEDVKRLSGLRSMLASIPKDLPAEPGKGGVTNESKNQVSQETGGSQNQERQVAQPVAPIQTETAQPPVEPKPSVSRASKVKKAVGVSRVEPVAEPLTNVPSKSTIKPTEQKKYLIGEVDRLIKEAPDTQDVTTTAAHQDNLALQAIKVPFDTAGARGSSFYDNVAAGARSLMEKYRIPQVISEKAQVDRLQQEIDKARFGELPHVIISVPGDGEFSIINSKEALKAFKERAAKFPTTTPKASVPSTPGSNPKSAGAVTKNPDHLDYAAAASLFHSDAENRPILQHAYSNGHEMAATDGRKLIIIKGKFGGSTKEPVFIDAKGKEVKEIAFAQDEGTGANKKRVEVTKTAKDYPDYKQVLPTDLAPLLKGASTEELFNLARQAEMIFNKDDSDSAMTLVMNPDGTLGIKAATKKGSEGPRQADWNPADYQHNVQDGAKPVTSLQLKYVQEIMTALRKIGNEKVDIYHKDELSPIVFKTKNAEVVLMPMRMASFINPEKAPKGWTEVPEGTDSGPAEKTYGFQIDRVSATRGHDALRALVNDPNHGLKGTSLKAFNALLDNPALNDLFGSIGLSIHDQGRGWAGLADLDAGIIHLSKSWSDADTASHEPFHFVYERLPEFIKTEIEAARQQALKEKFGDNIPEGYADGMSSASWKAKGLPLDTYPLISGSEYLATFAGETLGKQAGQKAPVTFREKVAATVRRWLQAAGDTLARFTGKSYDLGRVVRDVLSGKIKLTEESSGTGEKASFVSTEDQATAAEFQARNQDEIKNERIHFLAQKHDQLKAIETHAGADLPERTARLLDLPNIKGIAQKGAAGGPGEGYLSLLAKTSDPIEQVKLTRYAAASWQGFDRDHAVLEKKAAELQSEITSPSFVKKMDKALLSKMKLDANEQAQETAKSMLTTVMNKAKSINADKNLSDIEKATLEGQLKEVSEAQRSSSALSGLVTDMTKVLASTPQGLKLLEEGGNRNDFRRIYRDVKLSAGQPLHSEGLMNWASYLLEKAPEIRKQQLALELASDPKVSTAISAFEKKFLEAYAKDPTKAVMGEFRKATSFATIDGKARYAYKILNDSLLKKVTEYSDTQRAVDIGKSVLSDPKTEALRKEIRKNVGMIGDVNHPDAEPMTDTTLISPTGKVFNPDPRAMVGDKEAFNALRTRGTAWLNEAKDWLSKNEPGSPNHDYYQRGVELVESTLMGSGANIPNDPMQLRLHTYGILQNVARVVGGRAAAAFKVYVAKYDKISHAAANWTYKWSSDLYASKLKAIDSHGIKHGDIFGKMTADQANDLWWKQVGNELVYSGNRQSDPLAVGDSVGTMGWKVTKEDIQYARNQSEAASQGFKASGDTQVTKDETAGKGAEFTRKALPVGEYGAPVTPEKDLAGFSSEMAKGKEAYDAAKDDAGKAQALQSMEDSFNQNFSRVGKAFTEDRSFEVVKTNGTVLDGRDGAFAAVWPKIEDGTIQSAPEYWQALSEASGLSVDEVKAIALPEFGRMLKGWDKVYAEQEAKLRGVQSDETKNAFTIARGDRVAPYVMYRFGFKDNNAIRQFGSGIHSRAFDAINNGLNVMVDDLNRVKLERDAKVQSAYDAGDYDAKKNVVAARRIERQKNENMDDYANLEKKIQLVKAQQDLYSNRKPQSVPGILARAYQDLIGAKLGIMAMLNDVYQSPLQLGRSYTRLTGSWGKGYTFGTLAYLDGAARAIASLAVSGSKALAYDSFVGLGSAIKNAPLDKSAAKFLDRALGPMLKEITENAHIRLWDHQKFVEHGIEPPKTAAQDISNVILGSVIRQGQFNIDPKEQLNIAQKLAHTGMGTFEVIGKMMWNNWYRANDTVVNQGARDMMMMSKWSPIAQWETQQRRNHVRIMEDNRPYDFSDASNPINEWSSQEITGKTLGRLIPALGSSDVTKMNIIEAHTRAGLDFQKIAHEFQNKLKAKVPDAEMYTEAQKYALAHEVMNYENKQTKVNESQLLKDGSLASTLIRPYQSWSTRQWSNFHDMLSLAFAGNKTAIAKLLAFGGVAAGLLGFLVAGALTKTQGDMLRRPFQKALFNQVTASKLPWERQNSAQGWALAAANSVPYLGIIANAMFDDMPSRAAYDPSVAMLETGKLIGQYIGGAVQSGDITYRLPETLGSLLPDSKLILNRLESQSGKRENINAANLYRRYTDPDQVKAMGKSSYEATPLTPYAAKMVNAAVNGDTSELNRLRDEAVQVATALGKADPEKSVSQSFMNQMAERKALKSTQSPEQRAEFLSKLSPEDRAVIDKVESSYSLGAQSIGLNPPALVKAPKSQGGSVSRASRLTTGPARIGGGRVSRVKGLSRLKKVRLARVKTGRRSLARYRTNRRVVV